MSTANRGGGNNKGTRRTFRNIRKLPSKRFQARYVGPDGVEHRAPFTFTAKGDADRWLANEQVKITQGTWRPPQAVHEEVS